MKILRVWGPPLLLVSVGFFGAPWLLRATGAADRLTQIETIGECEIIYRVAGDRAINERCVRKHLSGQPYWRSSHRSAYANHRITWSRVNKNGLSVYLELGPTTVFGNEPGGNDSILSLRMKVYLPDWWTLGPPTGSDAAGLVAAWSPLERKRNRRDVEYFVMDAPLTHELAALLSEGPDWNLIISFGDAEQQRAIRVPVPTLSIAQLASAMEPQEIANRVTQQIESGERPAPVYGSYGLLYEGEQVALVANGKEPAFAKWVMQAADRDITYENGSRYQGTLHAGQRHGKGILSWPNGSRYEGDFVNDQRSGQGEFRWANGSVYRGEFVQGKRTGQGSFRSHAGWRYEGAFLNGQPHGEGRKTYANGDVYQGTFVAGNPTGRGSYQSPDGWRYEGEFKDGQFHGEGRERYPNGHEYKGGYRNSKPHGIGTWRSAKGWTYTGEWLNGKQHGKGRVDYSDGRSYAGRYEHGQRHGPGTFTYSDGTREFREYDHSEWVNRPERKQKERHRTVRREPSELELFARDLRQIFEGQQSQIRRRAQRNADAISAEVRMREAWQAERYSGVNDPGGRGGSLTLHSSEPLVDCGIRGRIPARRCAVLRKAQADHDRSMDESREAARQRQRAAEASARASSDDLGRWCRMEFAQGRMPCGCGSFTEKRVVACDK